MKNQRKRLRLEPTTIRTLQIDDLDRVRGGNDEINTTATWSKRYCPETAA